MKYKLSDALDPIIKEHDKRKYVYTIDAVGNFVKIRNDEKLLEVVKKFAPKRISR